MTGTLATTENIEFCAFKFRFEDGTIPPIDFFNELNSADIMESWDNLSPTYGSTVKNIIKRSSKNVSGVNVMLGVFVEATNIASSIEIIDITGKIESAEIRLNENDEIDVNDDQATPRLIFKFKRWRVGILPEIGAFVIERRSAGYDRKFEEYLTSWSRKWASKGLGRIYQSIKVEPYLTGMTPSGFLSSGTIGEIEFALSSDFLSEADSFFDSDVRDMLKKDKNLVVSIQVKAKRGQSFRPDLATSFIDIIRKYESNIQKCTGKTVVSNRKSKPVNLIDNLHTKVVTVTDNNDLDVLGHVETYLLELHEEQE